MALSFPACSVLNLSIVSRSSPSTRRSSELIFLICILYLEALSTRHNNNMAPCTFLEKYREGSSDTANGILRRTLFNDELVKVVALRKMLRHNGVTAQAFFGAASDT
jgi:hypothetical protein